MAITTTDLAVLQSYADGVMGRAKHHANQVSAAALALLGGIIWRADPGSLTIREHAGSMANMLWITIAGRRYAFLYNHAAGTIEIHDRTQSGPVLHSFDNGSSLIDIESAIRAL